MISPNDAGELNKFELEYYRKMENNIDNHLGNYYDRTTKNPVSVPKSAIFKGIDMAGVTTRTLNVLRESYIKGDKNGSWLVMEHSEKWVFTPRDPAPAPESPSQVYRQVADRPAADIAGDEPLGDESVTVTITESTPFPFPDHT